MKPLLPTANTTTTLTRIAHELARNFLVAASAAEDLTAESTMVTASKGCEFLVAVIALLTLAVRHPVLFQITVLEHKNMINICYNPLQPNTFVLCGVFWRMWVGSFIYKLRVICINMQKNTQTWDFFFNDIYLKKP